MPSLRRFRLVALMTFGASLAACSSVDHAIVSTENGASRIFGGGGSDGTAPVSVDLQSLTWQKLTATSAVQFAVVGGAQATPGATRVALKVPAGEAVPPYWQDAPQSYTVVSGTFVVEAVDGKGLPQHIAQNSGASGSVPARMIQRVSATAGGDGIMLLTVSGAWKPNFVGDTQIQRASN